MANQFKSNVPFHVQNKLGMLADLFHSEWRNIVITGEMLTGEVRLDTIQGNYVSGWMPRQDGGFSINALYRSDIDSSYHFTEKQTEWINEQDKQCHASFLSDNDIADETEWGALTEEQKESFCEYQNEWFSDGALFSVEMFVNGYAEKLFSFDKEPEKVITIRSSINYKDEYFREGCAEDIKQLILSVEEFMTMDNQAIINQFTV